MEEFFENLTIGSKGCAHGVLVCIAKTASLSYAQAIHKDAVGAELERFAVAHASMLEQLQVLIEDARANLGDEHAEIFEGHLTLVEDEELQNEIKEKIRAKLYSAEKAVEEFTQETCDEMMQLDEYFKERAQDFKDLGSRLIAVLQHGSAHNPIADLQQKSIIVAHELTPSMTAQMDVKNVLGFVTETGGATSHVSFIAQNLEIPALIGAEGICDKVQTGDYILVDALDARVVLRPSETEIAALEEKKRVYEKQIHALLQRSGEVARTKDGRVVKVYANIGSEDDARAAHKYGADGIGLFRTEFLFMGESSPSQSEQESLYKNVITTMEGKPVTVRMLDVGGDKNISYLSLHHEENPFLGYRGVRMYADHIQLIKEQIAALLLASANASVKIMVPILMAIREIRWFKDVVLETEKALRAQGKEVGEYSIGVMIETPAASILSNVLAREVDFFSIGSNDLIQYTLAVDRGEKTVAHLYQPFHPAVLRLIHKTVQFANKESIEVSLCGDMGGNEKAIPLLVAFGIDAVSTAPSNIPLIKNLIRSLCYEDLQRDIKPLRMIGTHGDAVEFIEAFFAQHI